MKLQLPVLISLPLLEPPAPPAWQMFTVDTGQVGLYSALAVDSNDKLHIAYFDNGNSNLKFATNSTGSWNDFTIDNTGSLGHYPSIDVDSNDAVHISYLAGLQTPSMQPILGRMEQKCC